MKSSKYEYAALDLNSLDVRLLTLLPGNVDDDIQVTIEHVSLLPPNEHTRPKITIQELQKTLPPNWEVLKTIEGKFIFSLEGRKDESGNDVTSWTHPDPDFDHSLYQASLQGSESDHKPKYDALSYTWGSPENLKTIWVGSPPTATLQITQNLARALQYLRYVSEPRTIWIDAICINQDDDSERNEQVRRMADIYKWAEHVVVWLGTPAAGSKHAMETLQHIGEQVEITSDHFHLRAPACAEPNWFWFWAQLPYGESTWEAINELLSRSWFSRLWIFQEIQLADPSRAVVQCGEQTVAWYPFRRALLNLRYKRRQPLPQLQETLVSLMSLSRYVVGQNFLALVRRARWRGCSDARDKVYGLLGVCSPALARKITPKYSQSVGSLYRDTFLVYLEHSRRLEMLEDCEFGVSAIDAPSWVPDWSVEQRLERMFAECSASGTSCAEAKYIAPGLLEVTGVTCGEVGEMKSPMAWESPQGPPYRELVEWVRSCQPQDAAHKKYVTGETLQEAYVTAICLGQTRERVPESRYPFAKEWKEILLPDDLAGSADVLGGAHIHVRTVIRHLKGMAFVTTSQGRVGLAPAATRLGDMTAVILGCSTPMILRPVNSNTGFQVIGACYIHGLMDAEALLGQLPEPWRFQAAQDASGVKIPSYLNSSTGEVTEQDARLEETSEWEQVPFNRTPDDPFICTRFRNRNSGQRIHWDPRLCVAALKERGVDLRTFKLV
ncbi:heterokaryon incompatibility protein-domain-containing protein [Xylaria longipes]|nr:heterokaryon incompatibility protein-domain-containing protein [Xylaria longipes]